MNIKLIPIHNYIHTANPSAYFNTLILIYDEKRDYINTLIWSSNNFNIILFYIAWANYGWRCRQKLIIECVNEFKKVQKQGATNIYYLASHYHQCPMQLNLSSDENGQWNLMAQKKRCFRLEAVDIATLLVICWVR